MKVLLMLLMSAFTVSRGDLLDWNETSSFLSIPFPSTAPTRQCIDPCRIDLDRICTEVYDPVCGCNGITYSNECFAEREGVVRWTNGECPPSPSPTPQPSCFTSKPTKSFLPCIDLKKVNTHMSCPVKNHPVCGCNGKTYFNKCDAIKHGVLLWKEGECS